MTRSTRLLLMLVGVLLLCVGVLVGQQVQRSKFDGYLRPGTVTGMDVALLEAQIETVRSLSSSNDGLGVPAITYDASCRCFTALVMITGDEFMKQSLDQVRFKMTLRAGAAYAGIKFAVPELSKWGSTPAPELKVTFQEFSTKGIIRDVAEYSNGQLVLK